MRERTFVVEELKEIHMCQVFNLILEDDYENERIHAMIQCYQQCTKVALMEDKIVGVSVFSGEEKCTEVMIYVKPFYRRRGIGSYLLHNTEEAMKAAGVQGVCCNHLSQDRESEFMEKCGYKIEFRSSLFIYTIEKTTECHYEVLPYEDNYYVELHTVLQEAYVNMIKFILMNENRSDIPPNEYERNIYKEYADSIYLMKEENVIVAVLIMELNEIKQLSVHSKHQKNGYGRELIIFAINRAMKLGYDVIKLWCLEGNSAEEFYRKLDFNKVRTHDFRVHALIS